jgi:hypothetical protein
MLFETHHDHDKSCAAFVVEFRPKVSRVVGTSTKYTIAPIIFVRRTFNSNAVGGDPYHALSNLQTVYIIILFQKSEFPRRKLYNIIPVLFC